MDDPAPAQQKSGERSTGHERLETTGGTPGRWPAFVRGFSTALTVNALIALLAALVAAFMLRPKRPSREKASRRQ